MRKITSAAVTSLALSLFTLITGCSSDSSDSNAENGGKSSQEQGGAPSAGADDGGTSNGSAGAEDGAEAGEGGADSSPGGTSAGGASAGNSSAGTGGSKPSNSPCSYTVSGGQSFPEGDAMYICSVNSRVYQKSGKGAFNALIGAAFSTESGDSSTFACSIDSNTAPKAGDTWTMNNDEHPGNCQLGLSQNQTATLWSATSTPLQGAVSIKFNSVTVKNGMYTPEDIYYLYDVTITAELKGLTAGAPDVTVSGSFVNKSLPLGG